LHEFIPVAGTSVNNPIDTNMGTPETTERTLRIVAAAENIDVVVTNPPLGRVNPANPDEPPDTERDRERALQEADAAAERVARLQEETGVPFVVLLRGPQSEQMERFAQEAYRRGVAVYPSIHRAARAISAVLEWRARRAGLPAVV